MTHPSPNPPSLPKPVACAVCGKPMVEAYRPFCSRRCADVDLGRWLGEGYRLPSDEPVDPEALAAAARQIARED